MHYKIILAGMALLLASACIPEAAPEDPAQAMKDALTQDAQTTPQLYAGKAYVVGTLEGPLSDDLNAAISFTPLQRYRRRRADLHRGECLQQPD